MPYPPIFPGGYIFINVGKAADANAIPIQQGISRNSNGCCRQTVVLVQPQSKISHRFEYSHRQMKDAKYSDDFIIDSS